MRVGHFDCFSGASGDMILGALIDAGADAQVIAGGLESLGLPIRLIVQKVRKGGFAATRVSVETPEEQVHRHLHHVEAILQKGSFNPGQRRLAIEIFKRLAEAEAKVHGTTIEKIHFHEVGALDSIADIAGAAIALDLLGVQRWTSRSVPPGSGMIRCAHGLMPVPAPATAELLKGVPLASSAVQSELTTPTGAAILATVVQEWIDQPAMTIEAIGVGAGTRDFPEQPNVLRLFLGTAAAASSDRVWVVETNIDDVPAEVIGYCYEQLFAAGALDVFSTPIIMKKNRPGIQLSVIAEESALPAVHAVLFRETRTLGIRRYPVTRQKLHRRAVSVSTPWGMVQGKLGWQDGEVPVFSPEYEDCARIAREHGVPLREVYLLAQQAYRQSPS